MLCYSIADLDLWGGQVEEESPQGSTEYCVIIIIILAQKGRKKNNVVEGQGEQGFFL